MDIRQLIRRIRWIVVLPILATAMSGALFFLAAVQEAEFWTAHPGFTDTPWELQQPARLFAELLNGPIFYFDVWGSIHVFGLYLEDFGRLPFIAVFWTWIGWALDRKLRGVHTPVVKFRWLRGTLYIALLALMGLIIYACVLEVNSQELFTLEMLQSYWRGLGLRAFVFRDYGMLVWAIGYVLYFGQKLLATFKPAVQKAESSRQEHCL